MDKIELDINELPKVLVLHNSRGDVKYYQIKPAGRKFGACLNIMDPQLQEVLRLNETQSQS